MKAGQSGVALVFALGILALLLVLGVSFVINMTEANKMASNLEAALTAEQASLSGVERAVAELKIEMRPQAIATGAQRWFFGGAANPSYGVTGQDFSGTLGNAPVRSRYTLRITDTASRININDQNTNLQRILEGLAGMDQVVNTQTRAFWVMDLRFRMPSGRFARKSQIRRATGMNQATYDVIQGFLVLDSYRDPNVPPAARSPVNINTAPREVLSAVVRPVLTDQAEADGVADAIVNWRGVGANGFFDTWRRYDDFINTLGPPALPGLTAGERENLRDNANPNRRNTWNRSDLIDPVRPKQSTEFCFHSGGMYEVESRGESLGSTGTVQAGATMVASLTINRILNVTTRQQFATSPQWYRVTWQDSCPVEFADDLDTGGYQNNYRRINDSVKVGFWDNFDEDEPVYTGQMIKKLSGIAAAGYALEDVNGDGEREFHHTNATPSDSEGKFADYEISNKPAGQDVDSWEFRSSYMKIWNRDDSTGFADPLSGAGDVGRLRFRGAGGSYSQAYGRNAGLLYIPNDPIKTGLAGNFTQAMVFEYDPVGSNTWVGSPSLNDERFGTYYLREIDGSDFDRNLHNITLPEAVPAGGLGSCGIADHVPPHIKYHLRIPEGAVISDLQNTGPDGRAVPNYLFAYTYRTEKWYRLRVFRRPLIGWEGTSMQISDSSGIFPFPPVAGFPDGELNTGLNPRGLNGIRINANLAAWDDIRILCPFGDYRGAVLDGGSNEGRWGAISWTRTLPAGANGDTEQITMDVLSSLSIDMANPSGGWTFTMPTDWTTPANDPPFPNGTYANEAGNNLGLSTLANQRFAQFRAYIGSTRPDTDARYCRETPVLEDVTATYFPPATVSAVHRESP